MLRTLVMDRKLDFQIIRGISVGALNAAFLAQAPTQGDSLLEMQTKVQELEQLWSLEIKGNSSVYGERLGGLVGFLGGADSLYSLDPLKRLMARHVSLEGLQKSGRDFRVGTVSLVSGKYSKECGPEDPLFMEKLLASASIPVVFPFVKIESQHDVLVDGGVRHMTPLSGAFNAQPPPDEIYVLLTSRLVRAGDELPESGVQEETYDQWADNWLGTKVNGLDVLKRTVELLSDEVYLHDLRGALEWNDVLSKIDNLFQATPGAGQTSPQLNKALIDLRNTIGKRHVPIYVLAPQEWYGEDNSSTEFSPASIAKAIAHGSEVAADPARWLWPPR